MPFKTGALGATGILSPTEGEKRAAKTTPWACKYPCNPGHSLLEIFLQTLIISV